MECACGHHLLTVGTRPGQVWMQVPCYLCDGIHFRYYPAEQFWDTGLKQIACAETDLQLGVLGDEDAVVEYVRPGLSELERFMDDEAFDDFFDAPAIMYQVLCQVQELSAHGPAALPLRQPGDRRRPVPHALELICAACGRQQTVPAFSERDLDALMRASYLEIGGDVPPRRRGSKK